MVLSHLPSLHIVHFRYFVVLNTHFVVLSREFVVLSREFVVLSSRFVVLSRHFVVLSRALCGVKSFSVVPYRHYFALDTSFKAFLKFLPKRLLFPLSSILFGP